MFNEFSRVAMVASCAGGCATLPEPSWKEGVSERDILRAVQCELSLAKSEGKGKLGKVIDSYEFKLDLDLKLVNDTNAGANAVLVLPQAPETISASMGLTQAGKASRQNVLTIELAPKKLPAVEMCKDETGFPEARFELGVFDWAVATFRAVDPDGKAALTSSTYEIEFTLSRAANGSIGVVAYRITGAAFGVGGTRASTHRLKLAATAPSAASGPQQVAITNWPTAKQPTKVRPPAAADAPPLNGLWVGPKPAPVRPPAPSPVAPSARRIYDPETAERLNNLLQRDRPLRLETR